MTKTDLKGVLNAYNLEHAEVDLLSDKGKKAVWRLRTKEKVLILKKLPGTVERGKFIAAALEHLAYKGANVPTPVQTKDGGYLAVIGNDAYLLTHELSGRPPQYEDDQDLMRIMKSLANFHKTSTGFQPPPEGSTRSHLGKWEYVYSKNTERLKTYYVEAKQLQSNLFEKLISKEAESLIEVAEDCIKQLQSSTYLTWVKQCRQDGCLCHQDYAKKNLLVDQQEDVYVFDFDSLTIDLPARDLRKITNKVMKKRPSGCDADLITRMFYTYQQVNPLSRAQWEVTFTELRFPHLLIGLADKYFRQRASDWNPLKFAQRLKLVLLVENNKKNVLEEVNQTWIRK